ncbi:hypothetical protein TRFO_34813 [Tritrichomonas foetus]|uniref:Ion transport domain-containing protein n=1 Tax=Tritrichomonas foetus TaxID=1144522 RepID=A0A1J4JIA1_9EUKA|nr:hypothetical protein TRFO_34813 [Tritrichomonas foetus]|eukprot:OHS98862.1 hypothetical protein TRFO_34813 [Tritrichomonas foetus]
MKSLSKFRNFHFLTGFNFKNLMKNVIHVDQDLLSDIPIPGEYQFTGVLTDISTKDDLQRPSNFFVNVSKDLSDEKNMPEEIVLKNQFEFLRKDRQENMLKNRTKIGDADMKNIFQVLTQTDRTKNIRDIVANEYLKGFVDSKIVNSFIGLIITFNIILICVETNMKFKAASPIVFQVGDTICITIYALELAFRIVADPTHFFTQLWNIFDFFIVTLSFILPEISFIATARVLRIIRIIRSFRLFENSTMIDIQITFNGFLYSLKKMIIVLVIILIFMGVCAFIGVSLFGNDSPRYFGTFLRSFWTQLYFLTMGGWHDVYLEMEYDTNIFALQIYIFITQVIGGMFLASIIVGVAFNALSNSKNKQKEENDDIANVVQKQVEESKRLKTMTKKLQEPPNDSDTVWDRQKPIRDPEDVSVTPEGIVKLYLVEQMISENHHEFETI